MRLWTRLAVSFLLVVLLLGGVTIYTGSRLISQTVLREAQYRTGLDLRSARSQIDNQLQEIQAILDHAARLPVARQAAAGGASGDARLDLERERLRYGLDVLSVCDAGGAVTLRAQHPYRPGGRRLPDPVVEEALEGRPASGITVLFADQLEREGDELPRQAFTQFVDTPRAKPRPESSESSGMMLWAAAPITDGDGRVGGALYGGILLNRNWGIVDSIRNSVFGEETYNGKELGTVTIFLWDVRVATNVKDERGNRAIGTRVSAGVYDRVLENGMRWYERAFVVNDWYLSAYEPIRDPRGKIVGILYTGILERKYTDQRNRILRSFITPVGLALALSIVLSFVLVRAVTRPVRELVVASRRLAGGDFDYRPPVFTSSPELQKLLEAYAQMADAIEQRDEELRRQNLELEHSNDQLSQLNRNYMEMLGFVTHELKSPVSTMIFSAAALRDGYYGPLDEDQKKSVDAIVKNAKYLSEMIVNYLNLSRIEKGEMAVTKRLINLRDDVVAPMLAQLQPQIDEAKMRLHNEVPESITLPADPALLRIVLDNLVSNAVQYGREGGRIEVSGAEGDAEARLSVWNEGEGIREEDLPKLFGKFVRLDQPAARARKGTGLGLFVSREIVEKHGGTIWAEGEPGHWARFTFAIPKAAPPPR